MPIYGRKMYGQLKRPPMEEWSKQRHVDHVALIYFQKMLQVLTPHTSKLPKKVLKNTKNMTPNSCSVRPEKFHPYITGKYLTKIYPHHHIVFNASLSGVGFFPSHNKDLLVQKFYHLLVLQAWFYILLFSCSVRLFWGCEASRIGCTWYW